MTRFRPAPLEDAHRRRERFGRFVRLLLLGLGLTLLAVACESPNPTVAAPFDLERTDDATVSNVALTWVNHTGLFSMDPTVWRPRLKTACNEDVWETGSAVELAERFVEADLATLPPPDAAPVSIARAADALWEMGVQVCAHLYPSDYEEAGPPFAGLTDVRGDAAWEDQASPRILDPQGLVLSATWRTASVPWSNPCPDCPQVQVPIAAIAESEPDQLVIQTRNTTCEPVVTLQLTQSNETDQVAFAIYDHLSGTYFGGDEYDFDECGAIDQGWELVLQLKEPLSPAELTAVDLRMWR